MIVKFHGHSGPDMRERIECDPGFTPYGLVIFGYLYPWHLIQVVEGYGQHVTRNMVPEEALAMTGHLRESERSALISATSHGTPQPLGGATQKNKRR